MQFSGWNHIPQGYGLKWDLRTAPVWLQCLRVTPFFDRLAYPVMVRRQFAYLVPHENWPPDERDEVPPGWVVRDPEPSWQPLATRPGASQIKGSWLTRLRLRSPVRWTQYGDRRRHRKSR